MANAAEMTLKRDLILAEERQFASRVAAKVIDKPQLAVWMILIPVFFVFYFWQLKRYADGRRTFAEKFLITRKRTLDEVLRTAGTESSPDINKLVQASDVPPSTRQVYGSWVTLLIEHYQDLIVANGGDYAALIRSTYKSRTNYLLFLNRLNQVEREFDAALKPLLDKSTEDVNGIIKLMETSTVAIRRQRAEEIFP